jgi:hypothetical protein
VRRLLQKNQVRYSGAIVVTIIYLSFIAAILNIQNPAIKLFVTFGINIALLFVIVNIAALLYGIITRNQKVTD